MAEKTQSFAALGHEAALDAVELHGLRTTGRCGVLRLLENRVYDVELIEGGHVVVKFYRPGRWSREALQAEHDFLLDLVRADVPVCAPLHAADGSTLGTYHGIHFGLWERTGGREPDEFSGEDLEVVGRLLGRVHAVGATRTAPARPRLDADAQLREPLDELLDGGFIPENYADRFEEVVLDIADDLDEGLDGVPFQRIHGDCHRGNVLRGDQGFFFLDFDDFVEGPTVHDLWVLLPERDEVGLAQRKRLLVGYRQFHDFDDAWWRIVEPLRATRFLKIAAWVARRWDEEAFRSAYPHFGSEAYWERETRDLEDQWEHIRRGDS